MILNCRCRHPYQDQKYGKGKRVHTSTAGKKDRIKHTCTVCLDVKG